MVSASAWSRLEAVDATSWWKMAFPSGKSRAITSGPLAEGPVQEERVAEGEDDSADFLAVGKPFANEVHEAGRLRPQIVPH